METAECSADCTEMVEVLELEPPIDHTHAFLWIIGFAKSDRDRIIETAAQMWDASPERLGQFIASFTIHTARGMVSATPRED